MEKTIKSFENDSSATAADAAPLLRRIRENEAKIEQFDWWPCMIYDYGTPITFALLST